MVVIRLARGGAKKRPFYKIVVADSRKPLKGRFIEKMGYYNPCAAGGEIRIHIDVARLDYWTTQGAQLSDRLSLLVKEFKKASVVEPEPVAEKPKVRSTSKAKKEATPKSSETDTSAE